MNFEWFFSVSLPLLIGAVVGGVSVWLLYRIKTGEFQTLAATIIHKAEMEAGSIINNAELANKQKELHQQGELEQKWQSERKKMRSEEERLKQREDKISWWMNLGREEMENIKRSYREKSKQLPREYHVAMNRLERCRRRKELAHLGSLPAPLAKAALRHRKANLSGSRAADAVRYEESKWNS